MVGAYQEALSFKEVAELEDAPYHSQTFSVCQAVVLYGWGQRMTPTPDWVELLVRVLLEQRATTLVCTRVDIDDKLVPVLWQRQYWRCEQDVM